MSTERPVYVIYLQPQPGVDGVPALRTALKWLLRRQGLRCIRLTTYDPLELDPAGERGIANRSRAHDQ